MAYKIVTELECLKNKKKKKNKNEYEYVNLTVGEIYESVCSNSPVDSDHFMVFDDDGDLRNFSKEYFEIAKTKVLENTGWIIKCKDCCHEISLKKLQENNNVCPVCGQKFNIN